MYKLNKIKMLGKFIKFWLLLLYGIVSGQYLNVPILYSQYTPKPAVDMIWKEFNCPDISYPWCYGNPYAFFMPFEINDVKDFEEFISNQDIIFILDITLSSVISSYISSNTEIYQFIHLVLDYTPSTIPALTYFSTNYITGFRDSAISLVKYFGLQKVAVLLSQGNSEMDFRVASDIEVVFQAILPAELSYETIYIIVSKQIKPLGIKTIIIATDEYLSKLIQQAILEAEMDKNEYVYVFIHQSAYTAYLEGAFLIEDYGWISKGYVNYAADLINIAASFPIRLLYSYPITGSYSLYTYYRVLISNINLYRFYFFNIQDSEAILLGNIDNRVVNPYGPITFRGGVIPDNSKIKLPISISGGYANPDGSKYFFNAECQYGSVSAVNAINTEFNILENFDLIIYNITDCGASYFDGSYASKCFSKHRNDLGYFHVPSQQISMIDGTMTVFKALNISVPVLGVQASASLNSDYFPQYTSVSFSNTYSASAIVFLLASYRIKRVSLLYLDNSSGKNFKNIFVSQAEAYKIEILNKNQAIPSDYNGTDKSMLREIVDIKSRYVVIEVTNTEVFSVINGFYELGMRKGDLYLIFTGGFSVSNSDIVESEHTQLLEIADGSLYIRFLSFYGSYGKQIYSKFEQEYGLVNDYMCLFYDATYLGAYAIDSMISRGFNLNSSGIEEWIRKVQFRGCSGNVQISKSGNDRSTIKVGVYNLKLNNASWDITLSGVYDPTKAIVLEALADISWYTENNGVLPSEIIGDDLSCPFKSDEVRSFPYGYLIIVIIGVPFLIFDIYFLYKNFGRKFSQLQCKTEENILDTLQYFIMLIECLQYIAIGPDFKDLFPESFNRITKISTLDLRGWNPKYEFKIWYQITLMESFLGLWLVFLVLSIFEFWRRWKISLIIIVSEIGKICLPIIGDILFLPMIWFLLLTFQCTESIGDKFTESFHNQDCTVFCWKDDHAKYVVGSIFSILVYLPTSLYYRPDLKDNIGDMVFHFKEHPCNSTIKSFMQILLVILNVALLPYSDTAHAVCFIFIIGVFGVFTLYRKPYSYDRASLWYSLFIFSCAWLWICCEFARINVVFGECILAVGWLLLIAIGVIYQKRKLPSFLETPKGQDILSLFKFQLSKLSPSEAGIRSSAVYIYVDNSSEDIGKSDIYSENSSLRFLR
ncbi:unnamed protein product [Blepharisma stoltei]|uniref:Receptor ligand binding region domain-containing protein n=1 Tax=Blepharisma stoltei TaxID=1481888 RepID=A0AAU9JJE8_9CILI|nr:unnamed protein product [Blepharisma stoltei]